MSVLIKDMAKPKSCVRMVDGELEMCPFVNTDDDCVLQLGRHCYDTWEDQYADCPLVELPEKHGRLIDADMLEQEIVNGIKAGNYEKGYAHYIKNGKHLPRGEWLRMSDLSEKDDNRYKCSRCGNVIHHKSRMDLYTFNSWCGRCGSDNRRHTTIIEANKWEEDAPVIEAWNRRGEGWE